MWRWCHVVSPVTLTVFIACIWESMLLLPGDVLARDEAWKEEVAPHTAPLPMALLLPFCRVSPYGRVVQQLRLDLWKACFDSCCCPHVGCFLMSPFSARIRTHVNNRTTRSHSPPTSYSAGATCSAEPGSKLTSITGTERKPGRPHLRVEFGCEQGDWRGDHCETKDAGKPSFCTSCSLGLPGQNNSLGHSRGLPKPLPGRERGRSTSQRKFARKECLRVRPRNTTWNLYLFALVIKLGSRSCRVPSPPVVVRRTMRENCLHGHFVCG